MQLRRYFQQSGGVYMLGDTAVRYEAEGGRITALYTADHGDIAFEADSYVLATGSYFSQGLVAGMDGVREPLFGLDVACAADRGAWYDRDLFAAQPFELFGVKCDEHLRGLRDGRAVENLYVIGAGLAGIRVFATGGVGGVHRGAETTMDISADLEELAQTQVLVVCAGAKSILDLGLTLEYLETKGVPVIGYRTKELPAFYTTHSGFQVDYRLDTPKEIADAFAVKLDMGLAGGMLVTNPIPDEYAMDLDYINRNIDAAIAEAKSLGIHGKDTTPFLLDKIQKLTGGDSLKANIQLVYNNARLGAQIASELAGK